ncbi:MAG: Fic family protein [Parvularculaceae bacterium]
MVRKLAEEDLATIEEIVRKNARDGVSAPQIAEALPAAPPSRTLQYWLKRLVDTGRLVKEGDGRWARYRLPPITAEAHLQPAADTLRATSRLGVAPSKAGAEIRDYVRRPQSARRPVGYNRAFLDAYRPNVSFYLSGSERAHLREVGKSHFAEQPAGTYAKQILNRLLIDLSWNSSRLEGNTYSLLDTQRLIEFGKEAEGRSRLEAQMILNHKDAIEILVGAPGEIGFNRYTILNLHASLAHNLLADPASAGRLRRIPVGIEKSTFHPLENPQLIEECFNQALATAAAIDDPFEQALFVMVQLPYLQPFDDVNKRVSRIAANIPFIKRNLAPLSFIDVPRADYTDALLGVYELNKTELMRDVFIWAYERSAERYAAVRQSLGEPDLFRLKYRDALRQVVGDVVRGRMTRKEAFAFVAAWAESQIEVDEREPFRQTAESDLLGLHEGNFARYQVTPSEFAAWRTEWDKPPETYSGSARG